MTRTVVGHPRIITENFDDISTYFAGADPGGSKRGLRHGQIFEIVIFSKLVYKDGSDRYLYV
jgi:hypothetical protein